MLKFVIGALAVLALAGACGDGTVTGESSHPPAALDPAGPWQLVGGTLAGQPLPLVEDARVTFNVEGSRVSGQAACNQYFGEFAVADGRVTLGALGQTEMACADPVMALEAAFLSALATVDSARMDGPVMVLTGPEAELRFERLQPPPTAAIVGTRWLLESLVDRDAVSSVVGEPATLVLHADGSLEGSTGCRALSGRYTIEGDEISANELAADGDCPGDVAAQDDHVVGVIGDGFRASVDGPQLTLSDDDGRGLIYRATGD